MRVKVSDINKQITKVQRQFRSIATSMSRAGEGVVYVVSRPRANAASVVLEGEKRRVHARVIVNALAKDGHDPFSYPEEINKKIQFEKKTAFWAMVRSAIHTIRPSAKLKDTLTQLAKLLADWAIENIKKGGLGQNEEKTARRKAAKAKAGIYLSEYGIPPPRGIATGRTLDAIKSRWKPKRRLRRKNDN